MDTLRTLTDAQLDARWHRHQQRIADALERSIEPGPTMRDEEDALLAEFDRRDRERGIGRWSDAGRAE